MNNTATSQTIDWKAKGKTAMDRIKATGILNKNYPDSSQNPNPNYSKEIQAALNILNAKYPNPNSMTMTNKGGKRRNKSKRNRNRNKSKRNKNKSKRRRKKSKRNRK